MRKKAKNAPHSQTIERTEQVEIWRKMKDVEKSVSQMYYHYNHFLSTKRKKKMVTLSHYLDFLYKWMEHKNEYEDKEKFAGETNERRSSPTTPYEFFISKDPLSSLELVWNFRYDEMLLKRLKGTRNEEKESIFYHTLFIASSYFKNVKIYRVGPINYMATFSWIVALHKILVFCIVPERVPQISQGKLKGYKYSQYIRFLDIVVHETKISKVLKKFIDKISHVSDKFGFFEHGNNRQLLEHNSLAELKEAQEGTLSQVVTIDDCKKVFLLE